MIRNPKDDRFIRSRLLLGDKAFERLREAFAVVVGLGAVGSFAAEVLARAGIGKLRLVDFDSIRVSNINRQLFAVESTIGKLKTDVARERIRDINPTCDVEVLPVLVRPDTLPEILSGNPGVLIDAIDSVGPKIILIEAACREGIPVVSSMGAALHRDPSTIRVGDLSQTQVCRLARFVRKRLAKRGIQTGPVCIYSVEPVPHVRPCPDAAESEVFRNRGRPRTPLGSLPTITGMFGLMAAHEALKIVTGDTSRSAED